MFVLLIMALIIYKRQRQIFDFIIQTIQSKGSAPTLREIADAIGVSSLATVHEHLTSLEEKGLIKRKSGKVRSIEIKNKTTELSQVLSEIGSHLYKDQQKQGEQKTEGKEDSQKEGEAQEEKKEKEEPKEDAKDADFEEK